MKMQTTAGQLRAATRLFRGVIQKRNAIPVLGTVRIKDGRLTGTDLDMELSVAVPTVGSIEGEALIDWASLDALVRCVEDDEDVTISESDGLASVAFNGSEYRMASLPVSDYPEFRAIDGVRSRTGNLGLVDALRRVQFCMSREETRYYLNGVAILRNPDGAPVIAATDGHRMAVHALEAVPDEAIGAIIPKDVVHYLCRQRREPDACVFDTDKVRARFEFAGMSLSSKLIDGTFPDIFRVIPKDQKLIFSIDRARMLRALNRISAFQSGLFAGVKISGADNRITLSIKLGDREASETLELSGEADGRFESGFNTSYLISALSGLRGDVVSFSGSDGLAMNPVIISSQDDSLRIVQMPMRV